MKEEAKYALTQLTDAFSQLKEGSETAQAELEIDGVIQRFEFTFELFWKALKIILEDKGVAAKTPRDVLKEAFRLEWLDNEGLFLNMLEDRNRSSHIYSKKTSREIFERIKNSYVPAISRVLAQLKKL